MVKKKTKAAAVRKKTNVSRQVESSAEQREPDDEKVAFLLRLDKDLHEQLKSKAERAGISLNQLIQGLCRGTARNLIVGEVSRDSDGYVKVDDSVRKCLAVGQRGFVLTAEERANWHEQYDPRYEPEDPPPNRKGFLWFGLDFSDRGVVQHTQE